MPDYNADVEKRKRKWYNMFIKIGGVTVFTIVLLTSFMIKTEPIKPILNVSTNVIAKQKIIIDAGHGGFDGGAVSGDGTVEKDINLIIALETADILRLCGYDVIMTRTDDSSTESNPDAKISLRKKDDMVNRLELINSDKSAICVSIHLNKFTTSLPSGAQVFYGVKNEKSYNLATFIQDSIKEHLQNENNRTIKKGTKSTYLLYNADIPIVIAECGFISNKNELELLKTKEYQKKMSLSISAGIINYLTGD